MSTSEPTPAESVEPKPTRPPRRRSAWPWLLALLLVVVALGYGAYQWQLQQASDVAQTNDVEARLEKLTQRLASLRDDQKVQAKRQQQAISTNRILRDELLALAERSALIEDSFASYSDPGRHDSQALRLDEAEILLSLGQQRLQIAGDLDGARRSYSLAAGVLGAIEDPVYLNLRQILGQERAALDGMAADPRALALARLDEWAKTIDVPAVTKTVAEPLEQPWWKRAFNDIVEVQDLEQTTAQDPAQHADAHAGLQLEVTLARAAAERRDADAFRTALSRADEWLGRQFVAPNAAAAARSELREIAGMPLSLPLPTLGTTLSQLRQLRADRRESEQ